ncbi:hypothetical protein M3Y94_00580900 [Aphelenchoides besseyi]|nr:hypothetical protein M3Y94_00580900 [Aphelenchoides besseyi]KAI6222025.1 RNase-Zc3h12a domain-containing protein [Aphelenchoides besseyi]
MSNEQARGRTEDDYDPSFFIHPPPERIGSSCIRRLIVIDGCNVLFNDTTYKDKNDPERERYLNKNATGLLWMVNYLMTNGFEVLVVVRRHFHDDVKVKNNYILKRLNQLEIVSYVGLNDDECILKTAKEYCGSVISNDQYQDHSDEYKEVIDRRIGFRFLKRSEWKIRPEDIHKPENRWKFAALRFEVNGKDVFYNFAHSNVTQPDYKEVQRIYQQISPTYFQKRIDEFNVMADYHQLQYCAKLEVKRPSFDYFNSQNHHIKFDQFFQEYKQMEKYMYPSE